MVGPVALGIPGLTLTPGDHVCGFYNGDAGRDQILLPFLEEGLRAGDACVCIVDEGSPEDIRGALDVTAKPGTERRLDVRHSLDTYFQSGPFSAKNMIEYWVGLLEEATASGTPLIRIVCEMNWALRDLPGVEELITYESEYNRYAGSFPSIVICLYDLDRFGASILMDVVKTHPKILTGGMIHDNPYFIEPTEFLAARTR